MTHKTTEPLFTTDGMRPGENAIVCPACSPERRKSKIKCLYVNYQADGSFTWYCQHCGYKGGKKVEETNSEPKAIYTRPAPIKPEDIKLSAPAIEWLKTRNISLHTAVEAKLFSTKRWMPQTQQEEGVIGFPFTRAGELINVKYRDRNKNFSQEKGAEKIFYGLDDIAGSDVAIIVEGEIDKLSFHEAGIKHVLSAPEGAPNSANNIQSKFDFIGNCLEQTDPLKKIIIAVDSDRNGQILKEELARRLGKERCWVLQWPEGIKDANEFLSKFGPGQLKRYVSYATPCPVDDLFDVDDFRSGIYHIYEHGHTPGLSTGWENVDELFKIRTGELTIATGWPGSGKSEFIDAIALNMAKIHDWRFAVCSFENPVQEHITKYAHKFIGKKFYGSQSSRMSKEELDNALKWLNERFHFISPKDFDTDTSIDWILEKAKAAIARHGIKGLIIDPYNEIGRTDGMTETDHVNEILKKLKRFIQRNDIHCWLVAHPTKPKTDKDGKPVVPSLYDIAGSAHFRNRADIGFTVHRDRDEEGQRSSIAQVSVSKIRFQGVVGKEGNCYMEFNQDRGLYLPSKQPQAYKAPVNDQKPYKKTFFGGDYDRD